MRRYSMCTCVCFFFKQKTAYEMRISDWSSDVCSSALLGTNHLSPAASALLTQVASAVSALPNPVAMRGHTDSRPYNPRPGTAPGMNNWILSTQHRKSAVEGKRVSLRVGLGGRRFSKKKSDMINNNG